LNKAVGRIGRAKPVWPAESNAACFPILVANHLLLYC